MEQNGLKERDRQEWRRSKNRLRASNIHVLMLNTTEHTAGTLHHTTLYYTTHYNTLQDTPQHNTSQLTTHYITTRNTSLQHTTPHLTATHYEHAHCTHRILYTTTNNDKIVRHSLSSMWAKCRIKSKDQIQKISIWWQRIKNEVKQ